MAPQTPMATKSRPTQNNLFLASNQKRSRSKLRSLNSLSQPYLVASTPGHNHTMLFQVDVNGDEHHEILNPEAEKREDHMGKSDQTDKDFTRKKKSMQLIDDQKDKLINQMSFCYSNKLDQLNKSYSALPQSLFMESQKSMNTEERFRDTKRRYSKSQWLLRNTSVSQVSNVSPMSRFNPSDHHQDAISQNIINQNTEIRSKRISNLTPVNRENASTALNLGQRTAPRQLLFEHLDSATSRSRQSNYTSQSPISFKKRRKKQKDIVQTPKKGASRTGPKSQQTNSRPKSEIMINAAKCLPDQRTQGKRQKAQQNQNPVKSHRAQILECNNEITRIKNEIKEENVRAQDLHSKNQILLREIEEEREWLESILHKRQQISERINASYRNIITQNDTQKFFNWTIDELRKVKKTEQALKSKLSKIIVNKQCMIHKVEQENQYYKNQLPITSVFKQYSVRENLNDDEIQS